MIFKDKNACDDHDHLPKSRGDDVLCLNCGKDWWEHNGWGCSHRPGMPTHFKDLDADKRYETQSMSDSLTEHALDVFMYEGAEALKHTVATKIVMDAKPKDIPEWLVSRNDQPGECACGIVRSMCDYHK